jgi:hypothetical protein
MQTYWVTVSIPIHVPEGTPIQDVLDSGWERLIDPDGPPEGLIEVVSPHLPVLPVNLLPEVGEPLLADLSNIETATEVDFPATEA